ncbi:hypothetical protein [Paracraurococcus ruber]|nr:hypothetical protein [Paracraurococcus ruber]
MAHAEARANGTEARTEAACLQDIAAAAGPRPLPPTAETARAKPGA